MYTPPAYTHNTLAAMPEGGSVGACTRVCVCILPFFFAMLRFMGHAGMGITLRLIYIKQGGKSRRTADTRAEIRGWRLEILFSLQSLFNFLMLGRLRDFLSTHVGPLLRPENYATGAALQERADLLRLVLLASARESWPSINVRTMEDVQRLAPTLTAQRDVVKDHVQRCTLKHLAAWHAERPPPLAPEDPQAPLPSAERERVDAEHAAAIDAAQRRAFGYALSVATSDAPGDSGQGVFLAGSTPPGSVVAFFPGVAYTPLQLMMLPDGNAFFEATVVGSEPRTVSHRIPPHPTASHRIPPHSTAFHRIPPHPIASHRIPPACGETEETNGGAR